jgi:hypothetical protein
MHVWDKRITKRQNTKTNIIYFHEKSWAMYLVYMIHWIIYNTSILLSLSL